MSGRWKDARVRGNDVQVGDYFWVARGYRLVREVQFGVPHEGWVRVVLGEIGNEQAPGEVLHFLGEDDLVIAKRSGDKPSSEWVRIPREVLEEMPVVMMLALKAQEAGAGGNGDGLLAAISELVPKRVAAKAVRTVGAWMAETIGVEVPR